jgi:hypothetical protein
MYSRENRREQHVAAYSTRRIGKYQRICERHRITPELVVGKYALNRCSHPLKYCRKIEADRPERPTRIYVCRKRPTLQLPIENKSRRFPFEEFALRKSSGCRRCVFLGRYVSGIDGRSRRRIKCRKDSRARVRDVIPLEKRQSTIIGVFFSPFSFFFSLLKYEDSDRASDARRPLRLEPDRFISYNASDRSAIGPPGAASMSELNKRSLVSRLCY